MSNAERAQPSEAKTGGREAEENGAAGSGEKTAAWRGAGTAAETRRSSDGRRAPNANSSAMETRENVL